MVTFVVLFDIDGTLLSSKVAEDDERRRYSNAIRDVVGQTPVVAPGRFAGMVDPQICQILLTELGLTAGKVHYYIPKVLSRMTTLYKNMDKRIALNIGVSELLPLLAKSSDHLVGVLTGNLKDIAREKLTCTGIISYFSVFYCADHFFDRTELVADAVKSCSKKYQLSGSENVLIVGDTPLDIGAANAAGATSIGIASSVYSTRQLSEARANQVYSNLKPTEQLLQGLEVQSG